MHVKVCTCSSVAGRVKTLHPGVHGGILARRDVPDPMAALEKHGIAPIDLVVVNLYPFRQTVTAASKPSFEVLAPGAVCVGEGWLAVSVAE